MFLGPVVEDVLVEEVWALAREAAAAAPSASGMSASSANQDKMNIIKLL